MSKPKGEAQWDSWESIPAATNERHLNLYSIVGAPMCRGDNLWKSRRKAAPTARNEPKVLRQDPNPRAPASYGSFHILLALPFATEDS